MGKMRPNAFIVFVVLLFVIALVIWGRANDRTVIRAWATENGYRVVSIEEPFFDTGPFWLADEHETIYRCILVPATAEDDGLPQVQRRLYVRTGIFGNEYRFAD